MESISPSHFPKDEDAFHKKITCALANQDPITPSPKRKSDVSSGEKSEKRRELAGSSEITTSPSNESLRKEDEEDPLTGHLDLAKPKFDIYKHIKFDSDHVVENQSRVYHCGICGNYAALSQETLEKHWKSHYQERPHKVGQRRNSFEKYFSILEISPT